MPVTHVSRRTLLAASAAQVFFAARDFTAGPAVSYSMDAWDGYAASRQRIMDGIRQRGVQNPVVLTGDVHKHYANNLLADFRNPTRPPSASNW
jgi:alkaline phosphatase D